MDLFFGYTCIRIIGIIASLLSGVVCFSQQPVEARDTIIESHYMETDTTVTLIGSGAKLNGNRIGYWALLYAGNNSIAQTIYYGANESILSIRWYYPNGQIMEHDSTTSSTYQIFESYNPDGTLSGKTLRESGFEEGWTFFIGGLTESHYRRDLKNPQNNYEVIRYFESGVISERSHLNDVRLDGLQEKFRSDGTLISKCNYQNGLLNGLCESFDPSGKPVDVDYYIAGVRIP